MKVYHMSELIKNVPQMNHGDLVVCLDGAVHQVSVLLGTPFFGHCDPDLAEEANKAWDCLQGKHDMTPKRFVTWTQASKEEWWGCVNGAFVFNIVGSSEGGYHLNSCTIPATLPISAGVWARNGTNHYQAPVEHFGGIYDVFASLEALQILCEAEFANWGRGV